MLAMLSWRFWAVLAVVAALGVSHAMAYRKGAANVRIAWQAATAQANAEARSLEQARQRRADEAQSLAAARAHSNVAAAAVARAERDGLRDDLSAVRLHAAQSLAAATNTVAALSTVFEQCSRSYQGLAEIADRHANDALTLQQAWPK